MGYNKTLNFTMSQYSIMVIMCCLLRHFIKIEHDVVQENASDFQTSVITCHS